MNKPPERRWSGQELSADVFVASAGVAQTILVEGMDTTLLVDVGDGALRDLLESGRRPKDIDAICITHGHYDHMGGLHSLLGFMRMEGRSEELPILLPESCKEALMIIRSFEMCYNQSNPYKIDVMECVDRGVETIGGLSIEPVSVVHHGSIRGAKIKDQIPAIGYRIKGENETVAITGDTGMCDGVRYLVKGADLAIIEATYPKSKDVEPELLAKVHLNQELASELAATCKNHLLVHQWEGKQD